MGDGHEVGAVPVQDAVVARCKDAAPLTPGDAFGAGKIDGPVDVDAVDRDGLAPGVLHPLRRRVALFPLAPEGVGGVAAVMRVCRNKAIVQGGDLVFACRRETGCNGDAGQVDGAALGRLCPGARAADASEQSGSGTALEEAPAVDGVRVFLNAGAVFGVDICHGGLQ